MRKGSKMGSRINIMALLAGVVAVLIAGSGVVGVASAHFTMLIPGGSTDVSPKDYFANLGEEKTVLITWGCPFKELFDCIDIPAVAVRDPGGNITQLTPVETSVEGVKAYKVSFTVEKRGDYIVYSTMNVSGIKGDFVDHAKAVIHCGQAAWTGWEAELGESVEIVPYIRPYGLEEGAVFKARAIQDGEPLTGATVYVVKYRLSDDPPAKVLERAGEVFPQDSWMMVKGFTKTDSDGDFVYTLDEPGIWTMVVFGKGVMERGAFILPVFESFPPSSTEEFEVFSDEFEVFSARPEAETRPVPKSPAVGLFATVGLIGFIAVLLSQKGWKGKERKGVGGKKKGQKGVGGKK